jgi:hypothetical protein
MRRSLLAPFCLLFTCWYAQGQSAKFELGFGIGAAVYQGDLTPNRLGNLAKPDFSFQVLLNYNFHPAVSLRANFAFATLREDESRYQLAYHQHRNFRFETSVNELSAQVVFNPLNNTGSELPASIRPYLFGGAGISFLGIKRDHSRFDHNWNGWQSWVRPGLEQDSLTTLPTSIVSFPVGAGLRYVFGENLSLYVEGSHRFTKNGFIDGFSHAANPKVHDTYTTATIGLIFKLSGSNGINGGRGGYGCPVNVW